MTQHDVQLPIACVEGWSAGASWTGVSVRELVRNCGRIGVRARAGGVARGRRPISHIVARVRRGRRPPDAIGVATQRRRARPRSRLSVPAHRGRSTRRHANEMGHPAGGAMKQPVGRVVVGAIGLGLVGIGVRGILTHSHDTHPRSWLTWVIAAALAHDLILAPASRRGRRTGRTARPTSREGRRPDRLARERLRSRRRVDGGTDPRRSALLRQHVIAAAGIRAKPCHRARNCLDCDCDRNRRRSRRRAPGAVPDESETSSPTEGSEASCASW